MRSWAAPLTTQKTKGNPVAIYHLSAKPISRASGRSATGAAAYRAGEKIVDERTGEVHDYTRKGGVLHSELVLPGGENADRAEFWNRIEAHHKRGDAVLAREVEVSLPTELEKDQRQALAVGYAGELADRYGVAADVALHAPRTITDRDLEKNPGQYHETDPETGRRHNGNWHAHITLSACHVQPDGTLGKKAVELDPIHCQRHKLENMADRERVRWAELANAALERHGHEARVDHRSLEAQGVEREPMQHKGPAIAGIERRGDVSEVQQRIEAGMRFRQERAEKERARLVAPDLMAGAERFRQRWGDMKAEKARQEKAEQERQAKERQAKALAEKEQRQRDLVGREFKGMAAKRAANASGYRDSSKDWQATPEGLQRLIDDYNKQPKEAQERALAIWTRDPQKSRELAEVIEQRKENIKELDQGMELGG